MRAPKLLPGLRHSSTDISALLLDIYKGSYVSVAIRQATFLSAASFVGHFSCICGCSSRSIPLILCEMLQSGGLKKKYVLLMIEFSLVAEFLVFTGVVDPHSCSVFRSLHIWVHCSMYLYLSKILFCDIAVSNNIFSYWSLKSPLLSNSLSLLRTIWYWPCSNSNSKLFL